MKDETTPRGHENPHPEDDRLVKELESLNKTIESLDSSEVDTDVDEDPGPYYKILQIDPRASLTDIHNAFEKMNEAWDPERYPQIISWKEKAKKKRMEIRNAYDKLLRLHSRREKTFQEDGPSAPLITKTIVRPEYYDQKRPLPPSPAFPASSAASSSTDTASPISAAPSGFSGNLLRLIIGIGTSIVVFLILIFLWPSLYHYEAIHLGGKEYPLRINRITSHTTYYDGRQWLVPPVKVEVMQPQAAPAPPVQPALPLPSAQSALPVQPQQPAQSAQTVPPAPPLSQALPAQPVQSAQPVPPSTPTKPVQAQLPSTSSRTEFTVEGKPSSIPQQKVVPRRPEKKVPPPKVAVSKTNISKSYSIQITAYPEKEKAVTLAKRLREGKIPARVEEVAIKGKGRWHRVLIGKFKDRDVALKYFNDHKIGQLYPQSFIQKPAN